MLSIIISRIKSYRHASDLKFANLYTEKGRSHFLESFKLRIGAPEIGRKYLHVGDDTLLDCSIIFESSQGNVIIGNRSYVGSSKIICRTKVEIEDNVFIAWGCYIYDHDSHSLNYFERQNDISQQLEDFRAGKNFIANKNWNTVNAKPIKICSNAWIGMHCTILKGVTVGEGAIVGAASVVTKDVPPWTIVGGNPAKVLKEIPENLRKK